MAAQAPQDDGWEAIPLDDGWQPIGQQSAGPLSQLDPYTQTQLAQQADTSQPEIDLHGGQMLEDVGGAAYNLVGAPLVSGVKGLASAGWQFLQDTGKELTGEQAQSPVDELRRAANAGADTTVKSLEDLTYQPKTEVGEGINKPFEWLQEQTGKAGQKVLDITGSPELATLTDVGLQSLPFGALHLGVKGAKALRGIDADVAKPAAEVAQAADEVAKVAPQDDLQAAIKASQEDPNFSREFDLTSKFMHESGGSDTTPDITANLKEHGFSEPEISAMAETGMASPDGVMDREQFWNWKDNPDQRPVVDEPAIEAAPVDEAVPEVAPETVSEQPEQPVAQTPQAEGVARPEAVQTSEVTGQVESRGPVVSKESGATEAAWAAEGVSLANRFADKERLRLQLEKAQPPGRKGWSTAVSEGLDRLEKNPQAAEHLIADTIGKNRPLSDADGAVLGAHMLKLKDAERKGHSLARQGREAGDANMEARGIIQAREAAEKQQTTLQAMREGGTAGGRGLSFRGAMMEPDYSVARNMDRVETSFGDKFNGAIKEHVQKLSDQLREKDAHIARLEAERDAVQTKRTRQEVTPEEKQRASIQRQIDQQMKRISDTQERISKRLKACPL